MMIIKAISLHQPHASLIAAELKFWETRSWQTSYRGPLLICASKFKLSWEDRDRIVRSGIPEEAWDYFYNGCGVFHHFEATQRYGRRTFKPGFENLAFGKALCVVDLVACISTDIIGFDSRFKESDRPFGNFGPNRFAWRLENIRSIEPFPVRGYQGLFDVEVPDEFLAEVT